MYTKDSKNDQNLSYSTNVQLQMTIKKDFFPNAKKRA